jgi:hypothetical protein
MTISKVLWTGFGVGAVVLTMMGCAAEAPTSADEPRATPQAGGAPVATKEAIVVKASAATQQSFHIDTWSPIEDAAGTGVVARDTAGQVIKTLRYRDNGDGTFDLSMPETPSATVTLTSKGDVSRGDAELVALVKALYADIQAQQATELAPAVTPATEPKEESRSVTPNDTFRYVAFRQNYSKAGGLFGLRENIDLGVNPCPIGTRSDYYAQHIDGNMNCWINYWTDPNNPGDCRVNAHFGVAAFQGGDCTIWVYANLSY